MTAPNSSYRVSVKALIINENKELLLIQEDNGTWELPGGGLDFNEDINSCLKREIKEELGANIKSINKTPTYIWTEKKDKSHRLFIAYKVKLSSLKFHKCKECIQAKFYKKRELAKLNLHTNIKKLPKIFKTSDF